MTVSARHHSWRAHMRFMRGTVLGLNRRNSAFIFSLNPQHLLPLVDDKLMTKECLRAVGIPVPETYGIVRYRYEIKHADTICAGRSSFVLKPSRGRGGGGIVVCDQPEPGRIVRSNGAAWQVSDMQYHIDEILSGVYSLDERADVAMFEHRVTADAFFAPMAVGGLPDIRILVVRGIPVLAMLRLPTHRSDGRANLHVGGVGVGVDLATGATRRGIYRNFLVRRHPDTNVPIEGMIIPQWESMLRMAAQCYAAVPLGYLGVDIVLDAEHGPLVLELNARPGLQIQLANGVGLRPLLEAGMQHGAHVSTIDERIAMGQRIYADVWRKYSED
jgi:alpha-L-glutamate ligase-like protein